MYHSLPCNCFFSPQQSQALSIQKALKIRPTSYFILLRERYRIQMQLFRILWSEYSCGTYGCVY